MELKQSKVYVPTDIKIGHPKDDKWHFVLQQVNANEPYIKANIDQFKDNEWNSSKANAVLGVNVFETTHFLKEKEGYFLTKEELERVIGDAFDAGRIPKRKRVEGYGGRKTIEIFIDKQDYIKQILK